MNCNAGILSAVSQIPAHEAAFMYDSCLVVSVSSFRYTATVGLNLRPAGKEVTTWRIWFHFLASSVIQKRNI